MVFRVVILANMSLIIRMVADSNGAQPSTPVRAQSLIQAPGPITPHGRLQGTKTANLLNVFRRKHSIHVLVTTCDYSAHS